jgi:predicted  nucleic acid-binding Zn-ribbon protein
MSDKDETIGTRLWRDRAQIREKERDDAQARLRIAEDRMATLMHEINQLTAENARLRTLLNPDAGRARSETERQMAELRGALMPLLADPLLTTQ